MRITAKQVLNLAEITISLVGNEALLCVTVPGHIDIKEQIELAQKLEELEIDLIQTEGSVISEVKSSGARGLIEKALVSIANTLELSRNVDIPIMTSSGITPATAPMAFAAGASAVGVGSCVNRLSSSIEMIATVRSVVEASTPCIMHISDEELYI
jgi:2,4-dienoyl-CoA reductase-like NADH-dependent reductase (Old Yellow Enzyme family)